MLRDQEVMHFNVQLPMEKVFDKIAIAALYLDGDPCIVIGGWGKGAGVYILHAVTVETLSSLPYKQCVFCVCIDTTGTQSGWIC